MVENFVRLYPSLGASEVLTSHYILSSCLFSAAPDTVCMVCQNYKKGQCLRGKDKCIMEQGPGCRTRDFFIFSKKDGWRYNHTELGCDDYCSSSNFYFGDLKVSTFCCKGRDFCNIYHGKGQEP
uniref:UPAR/Ly6 domain-containing protein n=1 Tax=Catagonus wagneri TaxID=51154 RepID=A0A8C3VGS3_9CETA